MDFEKSVARKLLDFNGCMLFFAKEHMAYLKEDKKSSGTYLRIMESYRDSEGRSRSRTLYQLGKVEDYSPEELRRIGSRLYELGGGNLATLLGDDTHELGRYNYGFYQIYTKILKSYGLNRVFDRISSRKKLSYDLNNCLMLMLLERLNEPASKLGNYENQSEYVGIAPVELHHLYRSLDQLAAHDELIQSCIYQYGRSLFNQQLDVVFFDVTTFYFDSDKEYEGALRQKGFSKDGKIGKTQILFGLLIDKDKQPIGYELYRGDYFEGHSFVDALDRLKKRYEINKIIIVADRGMLNATNLEATVDSGYDFIVGEKLKQLPKAIQEPLLNLDGYIHEWLDKEEDSSEGKQGKKIKIRYQTIEYNDRTIIATYSEKRARKDALEREKKLIKAEEFLKNPSRLNAKSRRHYITQNADEPSIDEEKVAKDKRYDGILAISTNNDSLSVEDILDHYKNLYRIEHSFRTFKSHLETRPMFHWTDKRIKGHICLCYITYALLSRLQLNLRKAKVEISERKLRKLMSKMQLSHIKSGDKELYMRAKLCDETKLLLKKMGIKQLPHLFSKDLINSYL